MVGGRSAKIMAKDLRIMEKENDFAQLIFDCFEYLRGQSSLLSDVGMSSLPLPLPLSSLFLIVGAREGAID